MGVEDDKMFEQIDVSIDKKVLSTILIIGLFSFMITGFFIYYFSGGVATFILSMVLGSTIAFLGIYFSLILRPLFQIDIKPCLEQEEKDEEFQSIMKVD